MLHLILAVANLLAHNNITVSYYLQANSLLLKSSVASKWASKNIWGGRGKLPFILLLMVSSTYIIKLPSRKYIINIYRRFNAIVSQLKMHYFSEGAFESLIASQLLKKEKYIWSY